MTTTSEIEQNISDPQIAAIVTGVSEIERLLDSLEETAAQGMIVNETPSQRLQP